ncbi:MAG: exodeoxyribonuclease VII large subunit [Candidatus Muiribacteriota bacterium]
MENIQPDFLKNSNNILTVSGLTKYLKKIIESDQFLYNVQVEGEISYFKVHSSGHVYFALKDGYSYIKCVMFRNHFQKSPASVKPGDIVIVKGNIGIYAQRGEYQLYVRAIDKGGKGELFKKFEELKNKLTNKGYFDVKYKKKIPEIISSIGIVSGYEAAGAQDMLKILSQEKFDIYFKNTRVQGGGASHEIARAIKDLNSHGKSEVIIIARGGGSIEDLWSFNEEKVAEAIFESEIPVISAVGHEIDFLISDFTADFRAETPTAAAELIVNGKKRMREKLVNYRRRVINGIHNLLVLWKEKLKNTGAKKLERGLINYIQSSEKNLFISKKNLNRSAVNYLNNLNTRIQKNKIKISRGERTLNELRLKLDFIRENLKTEALNFVLEYKKRIYYAKTQINACNPENILKKGFLLIENEKGEILKSVKQVKKKDQLNILLADGKVKAVVKEIY